MTRLEKWDQRVISSGNRMRWTRNCWFGVSRLRTQSRVIGAWGRKINLLKSGIWEGSNA